MCPPRVALDPKDLLALLERKEREAPVESLVPLDPSDLTERE